MKGQRNDERLAAVVWIGVSFAAVVAIAIAAAAWLGSYSERPPLRGAAVQQQVQAFPEPRLQTQPRLDLVELQQQRRALLSGYAWIDRSHGLGRIPVDAAIDVLLQRGFELNR